VFSDLAAWIHATIIAPRMPPRYGVEAWRLPNAPIRICTHEENDMLQLIMPWFPKIFHRMSLSSELTCCMNEPPDLPSGLPITSTAAFPFVLDSESVHDADATADCLTQSDNPVQTTHLGGCRPSPCRGRRGCTWRPWTGCSAPRRSSRPASGARCPACVVINHGM
jgi:hypothetical protein